MIKIGQIKTHIDKEERCENINLIIGPNNSGKTEFLRNIYEILISTNIKENPKWIRDIEFKSDNLKRDILNIVPNIENYRNSRNAPKLSTAGYRYFIPKPDLWNGGAFQAIIKILNSDDLEHTTAISTIDHSIEAFWTFYLNNFTAFEECKDRLGGPFKININELSDDSDQNILTFLFKNRDVLDIIKNEIKDVFGLNIGFVDLAQRTHHLRVLLKTNIEGPPYAEETFQKWNNASSYIENEGDGIKAYLRLVFSILQPYKSIVLIDEPETFLHPPQCRSFGNLVSRLSEKEDKQIFIATHNPDVLRGVISSGVSKIKIFYLNKKRNRFNYTVVNASDFENIYRNNINLINERILNSFFFKKTILCEGPTDRIIYEYAAALYFPWELFQDINFIELNGKGPVLNVGMALKKLGIEVSMIVDFDFICTSTFPEEIQNPQLKIRFDRFKNRISKKIDSGVLEKQKMKKFGIAYLREKLILHNSAERLIKDLRKYSIFVVPEGELESWTKNYFQGNINIQKQLNTIQSQTIRKLKNFLIRILYR